MDNERIKVYVGRRSMCAGDDMKAPNMKSFYLPDNLDEFAAKLDRILPFDGWTCYSGYAIKNVKGEEDGIVVGGEKRQPRRDFCVRQKRYRCRQRKTSADQRIC